MERFFKNLIKKPALLSVLAFALVFTVVLVSALAGGNENTTGAESNAVLQQPEHVSGAGEQKQTGFGLYIDGTLVAAAKTEGEINTALDSVKSARTSISGEAQVVSCSFDNVVTVVAGNYAEEAFVTSAQLAKLLGIEGANAYTASVTDYTGKKCGSLDIRVTVTNTVTQVLESEVVYVDNANLLSTHKDVVITEGQDGLVEEVYETVFVNGTQIQSKFVSSTVKVEAVDKIIQRGVLDSNRVFASNSGTSVENSPFIVPYDGIFVSSPYGWRSMGWHSGIDIINGRGVDGYGDPVWAARDGVVTRASELGTYGLVIYISHEDGSETRYAHLSTIKVEVGDYVEQGQIIGNIGTTGFVTGPHLHFEIRIGGETVDPLKYVSLYTK